MILVTKRYRFCASHRLHAAGLAAEENRRIYGKCNNPFGHGHDYELEVTTRGPLDPGTGRAVDLRALDELVRRQVIEPFDHRNLNAEIDAFRSVVPTSENLGLEIAARLKHNWSGTFPGAWPRLEKVCIRETPRNIFQVTADEIR